MTPDRPGSTLRSRPPRTAAERLFIAWFVSTILLLLLVTLATAYLRGVIRRQDQALEVLKYRVNELEAVLRQSPAGQLTPEQLEPDVPGRLSPTPHGSAGRTSPAQSGPEGPERSKETPSRGEAAPIRPSPAGAGRSAVPVPGEAILTGRIDALVPRDATSPADVRDRRGAEALLNEVIAVGTQATWSGPTWTRLAVLARLVGRVDLADSFAAKARQTGDPATEYLEVSVRDLLAHGRHAEALPLARALREQNPAAPPANLLLGAALWAAGQLGPADEALAGIQDLSALDTRDRLLLARLLMKLDRWEPLALVLADLGEVPDELADERDFLTAVSLARQRRLPEALAILDYLAGHADNRAPAAAVDWPPPRPTPYEIDVWRGYVLLQAGKLDAAGEILNRAAQSEPTRGEAYYVLGLLESRLPRRGQARTRFEDAVRRDPTLLAAWEALANYALDDGDTETAIAALSRAIDTNPRRASSHFMLAIVRARLAQREAAAEALRAAFALDDRYLAEATRAEVLLRLFTVPELEELARTAAEAESQPAAAVTETP